MFWAVSIHVSVGCATWATMLFCLQFTFELINFLKIQPHGGFSDLQAIQYRRYVKGGCVKMMGTVENIVANIFLYFCLFVQKWPHISFQWSSCDHPDHHHPSTASWDSTTPGGWKSGLWGIGRLLSHYCSLSAIRQHLQDCVVASTLPVQYGHGEWTMEMGNDNNNNDVIISSFCNAQLINPLGSLGAIVW